MSGTGHGLSEARALDILRAELPPADRRTRVGIGDDAAVLEQMRGRSAWTIDACIEGIHFERGWLSPEDLAHKSLQAAVSDLCAMGARPTALLVQLTLAPWLGAAQLRRLAREQAAVAAALGCPIVGGNLTAGPVLELVTTALGRLPGRPLLRSGARVGDEVWLLGAVGHARLGLLALQHGAPKKGVFSASLAAFRRPRALVAEGLRLVRRAHACLDVSDGLRRDAPRLAQESGVAVVLERTLLERLVEPDFARAARALGVDPLEVMLEGGEDYALLAVGPRARRPRSARVIGRIEGGQGAWLDTGSGRRPLAGGFEHNAVGSRRR